MPIVFDCPRCGLAMEVESGDAGAAVGCPGCGAEVLAPLFAAVEPPASRPRRKGGAKLAGPIALLGIALASGGLAWVAFRSAGVGSSRPAAVEAIANRVAGREIGFGSEVVLSRPPRRAFGLARTDDAWRKMVRAEDAKDVEELAIMAIRGEVFVEDAGARAKVIETSFSAYKVRIRDGKHPFAEGWIQREFVELAP